MYILYPWHASGHVWLCSQVFILECFRVVYGGIPVVVWKDYVCFLCASLVTVSHEMF